MCETNRLDDWLEKPKPEPQPENRPTRNRLRSRSLKRFECDISENREISPRLLEIRERRRKRELELESKIELELTKNSENGKLDNGKTEGTGDDVWKIIQSRTPEPLPDSEEAKQEKENVSQSTSNYFYIH